MRRAAFLDRDGVINVDAGYVRRPEDFVLVDGALEMLRFLQDEGYLLIIVTNQAGIGRGLYTEEEFHSFDAWVHNHLRGHGVRLERTYFCPFHPEHGVGRYRAESPDRKPAPGMILAAAADFGIDLQQSILVGNSTTDIEAGLRAGIGMNFLVAPEPEVAAAAGVYMVSSPFGVVAALQRTPVAGGG